MTIQRKKGTYGYFAGESFRTADGGDTTAEVLWTLLRKNYYANPISQDCERLNPPESILCSSFFIFKGRFRGTYRQIKCHFTRRVRSILSGSRQLRPLVAA